MTHESEELFTEMYYNIPSNIQNNNIQNNIQLGTKQTLRECEVHKE